MTIRLYLDEDAMADGLVHALRTQSVDLLTTREVGMIEADDDEQLESATRHGRVIYTYNVKDFHQLHYSFLAEGRSHAGMILSPQRRYSVGEQMRRLVRLSAVLTAEDMRDRAEFLSSWG